ncbi:MAG: Ig-like domain-containing protein [Candidatus Thorarchaeota archaeon]|jgi:endonuclease/exonuclease/phosphatase family metal-dependent hydrolase
MDTRKTIVAVLLAVLVSASLVVIFISLPATPPDNGETTDTTPPVITITGPSADAEVYGAEAITFSATDENGVPRTEIYIDGVLTAVGQSYNWNTLGVSDGPHTIMCRARDPSTNWANSTIDVVVNNSISFASPDFDGIFKVMTYNIQESGINPDWKEVVKEENADIIMFVETGYWDDDGSEDMIAAVDEFNAYFVDEDPYEGFCTQGISFSTSGEAVFSRFPVRRIIQIQSVPLDDETGYDVTHDFLDAVIDINGTSVHFVGVHLKAGGGVDNENRREWENEGIINYFDSLGDVPIVYIGDINSNSPVDTGPLAPNGDTGYGPMTMLIDPDHPVYGQYSSEVHNFTDVFRTLNPTDPGHSFGHQYTPMSGRIDYIITNEFFEDILINSTTGDTAHAFTGADHYSVDAFLNWSGGMNVSALKFVPDDTSITNLHPRLRIFNLELSVELNTNSVFKSRLFASWQNDRIDCTFCIIIRDKILYLYISTERFC